jgi:hypothetical protein
MSDFSCDYKTRARITYQLKVERRAISQIAVAVAGLTYSLEVERESNMSNRYATTKESRHVRSGGGEGWATERATS